MSYDIQCWDFTPSRAFDDFDTALKAAFAMEGKPRRLDSKLPAFMQAIEDHFQAPDQEPALQGHFFNFFSLASGAKEAVLRIDLPIEDRLRVFRDIVEIASRHAIAVLDEQMGILFLPDGRILPEEAGMAWEDIKAELDVIAAEGEFPKRLSDFKKMMTKDLIGYLSSAGFKKNRVDDRYGTVSYCRQGGGLSRLLNLGASRFIGLLRPMYIRE
jgi:hypothetical protein